MGSIIIAGIVRQPKQRKVSFSLLGALTPSVSASPVFNSRCQVCFPSYLLVPFSLYIPMMASEASLTFSSPLTLFNMGISSSKYILTDLQLKCVGVPPLGKLVTDLIYIVPCSFLTALCIKWTLKSCLLLTPHKLGFYNSKLLFFFLISCVSNRFYLNKLMKSGQVADIAVHLCAWYFSM